MPSSDSAVSLPERLLDLEVDEAEAAVVPRYLTTRDHGWVERLLLELEACEGMARREVEQRLRQLRRAGGPWGRRAHEAMGQWLLRSCGFAIDAACPPADIRAALFRAAAEAADGRALQGALMRTARQLGIDRAALRRDLYADIAAERRLGALPAGLSPQLAIERYNLTLAQGLLRRTRQLEVRVGGYLKAVLRFARLHRLLCLVERDDGGDRPRSDGDAGAAAARRGPVAGPPGGAAGAARGAGCQGFGSGPLRGVVRQRRRRSPSASCGRWQDGAGGARLQLSGPLSLFRQTTKYGHEMARWFPVLVRAPRWSLRADCVVGGRPLRWEASHRDPIGTTHAPVRPFDSALERRLFRDLRRQAPAWQLQREVDLVQIGRRIAAADFTLIDPRRRLRVPVEVVGFWTEAYLREKLATLAALPADRPWVVCIDRQLAARAEHCGRLPAGPLFVFDRRIDAADLLAFIEQQLDQGAGP